MKSKLKLLFVGVVLVSMMSVGSALAAISYGDSLEKGDTELASWIWEGTGLSLAFSGDVTKYQNYTFGVSGLDIDKTPITLLSKDTTFNDLYVIESGGSLWATSHSEAINLGASPSYYFWYNDGTGPSSTYTIFKQTENTYVLTDEAGLVGVTVWNSTATPSAVPIPGSALLLASGLLGLMGIGSRKNKA